MKKNNILVFLGCLILVAFSCSDYDNFSSKHVYPDQNVYGEKSIYIPEALKDNDFDAEQSQWCYQRSRQSENWICFWEEGFGDDPTFATNKYAVNVNNLLEKAEEFYNYYTDELKFVSKGESNTDQYKMMIFLSYKLDWSATGAGYDDVIGALWINVPAAQPVGAVVAHEVGHCFQYQVYCDDASKKSGFRYGFGENGAGGNGFWEQCAQWQSLKIYPEEQFTTSNFTEYLSSCNMNVLHETPRYANYFIQDYWANKHGIDIVGKIWRESQNPEDPIEAYKRIVGIDQESFNNEFFDYARHMVTWDLDLIRDYGKNYMTRSQCNMTEMDGGYWEVKPEDCPQNYGYNVINLNVPDGATTVSANFLGEAGAEGYRAISIENAGWRYGFVALLNDGSTVYSDIFSESDGTATFDCPDGCKKLCFVVSGAPTQHWRHAWDDDASNDEQWPYRVKFNATNLFGKISIDPNAEPKDLTLTYDLAVAQNNEYAAVPVQIDISRLSSAFVLYPDEIIEKFDSEIIYYGVNSDGTLNSESTASHPGHWFNAQGDICNWGESAKLYSEYSIEDFIFNIGQYPEGSSSGDKYTISQAFIYTNSAGKIAKATFVFNITIQ